MSTLDKHSCQWFPRVYHGSDGPDGIGLHASPFLNNTSHSRNVQLSTSIPPSEKESVQLGPVIKSSSSAKSSCPSKREITPATSSRRLQPKLALSEQVTMQSSLEVKHQTRASEVKRRKILTNSMKGVPEELRFTFSTLPGQGTNTLNSKRKKNNACSASVCLRCRQQKIKVSPLSSGSYPPTTYNLHSALENFHASTVPTAKKRLLPDAMVPTSVSIIALMQISPR
jgi:hypothetical protein